MTAPLEVAELADEDTGHDIDHLYCGCSPEVACCGAPLDGIDDGSTDFDIDPDTCVVCLDMQHFHECIR